MNHVMNLVILENNVPHDSRRTIVTSNIGTNDHVKRYRSVAVPDSHCLIGCVDGTTAGAVAFSRGHMSSTFLLFFSHFLPKSGEQNEHCCTVTCEPVYESGMVRAIYKALLAYWGFKDTQHGRGARYRKEEEEEEGKKHTEVVEERRERENSVHSSHS